MSDTAGPLEFRQHYANDIEAMQTHLDGRQTQMHTATPGIIVSYNATKMTASVQIALQSLHQKTDGTVEAITIQPITDVPVMFPSGGGHTMTFPIAAGDECLVVFNERSIDNWYASGGVQQPSDFRLHDINDAVCFVGIRSQPRVLGGGGTARAAGPPASTSTVQMRSDDGKTYVELDGANGVINMRANSSINLLNEDGSSSVQLLGENGNVTMTCPGTMTINCPTLHVTGTIMCDAEVFAQANTLGYVTLSRHFKHSGNPSSPTPGT